MPSHPNRGTRTASSTPTPAAIRAWRESHNLTLAQAGALVHSTGSQWSRWELGPEYASGRAMHPAFFELAKLKLRA